MAILFECVSFPRAGSSLLWKLLNEHFETRITSPYEATKDENPNLVKDHDFDLDKPIDEGVRYVVLIRDFEECCLSYYRFKILGFQHEESGLPYPYVDIDSEDYQLFRSDARKYYDGFVRKWIVNTDYEKILVVNYNQLLNRPTKNTERVLEFCQHSSVTPALR